MFKFYNTLSFEQSLDPNSPDKDPANIYTYRQWYEEDIQQRDRLVVTVGDSWTWGDHLGTIDWNKNINDPIRLTQIFGRKLADQLNADWVNVALPGCSNYWMLEQLHNLKDHFIRVQDQYQQIDVVVVLTEDLREETNCPGSPLSKQYSTIWDQSNSINNFFIQIEKLLFTKLEDYFSSVPMVRGHITRAFTDVQNTSPLLLDKTWCDVIQQYINFNNYQRPIHFIGQMAINPLQNKFITTELQKLEFLEITERVGTRWQFLANGEYNMVGSTYHPNPAGHQIWANYLYNKLQ